MSLPLLSLKQSSVPPESLCSGRPLFWGGSRSGEFLCSHTWNIWMDFFFPNHTRDNMALTEYVFAVVLGGRLAGAEQSPVCTWDFQLGRTQGWLLSLHCPLP